MTFQTADSRRGMRSPKPGERAIVMSFHPNPFPAANTSVAGDGLNDGLMVRPLVFRNAKALAKAPRDAGRYYEAEYVDRRPGDSAPRFRAIRRLRISHMDKLEVCDDGTSPGLEDAIRFLEGVTDELEASMAESSVHRMR